MVDRLRSRDGQAIVEFVLILPLFVTLVFVVVEFGIAFNNYLRVTDVARVAAREVAVARLKTPSIPCTTMDGQNAPGTDGLDLSNLDVSCVRLDGSGNPLSGDPQPGDPFKVTVTYPWSASFPFLPWSANGNLSSQATERAE